MFHCEPCAIASGATDADIDVAQRSVGPCEAKGEHCAGIGICYNLVTGSYAHARVREVPGGVEVVVLTPTGTPTTEELRLDLVQTYTDLALARGVTSRGLPAPQTRIEQMMHERKRHVILELSHYEQMCFANGVSGKVRLLSRGNGDGLYDLVLVEPAPVPQ